MMMDKKKAGSKVKYNKGGYASIANMEKKCGSKTSKKTKQ